MKKGIDLQEMAAEIVRRSKSRRDFVAHPGEMCMANDGNFFVGNASFRVSKLAHTQLAEYLKIPSPYYQRCLQDSPSVIADQVNHWLRKTSSPRMVRTLDGEFNAFLSDRYLRIDYDQIAEAILPVLLGGDHFDIMSCKITEKKMYIKVVDKSVSKLLAEKGGHFGDGGHTIVRTRELYPALTVSTSEVGLGALNVGVGLYDGFCSNLATYGEQSLRKYHVGSRISLDAELIKVLSDDTLRKVDVALLAEVKDVMKSAFDTAVFNKLCDKVDVAQQDVIKDVPKVIELASEKFGFSVSEGKSILDQLIDGGNRTRFGLYNAITRASQDVDDYDRATDLERAGAKVIELAANEWREMAEAA